MYIVKKLHQHRRDFTALAACDHCGAKKEIQGYDDEFYHKNIIPNLTCDVCGEKAKEDTPILQPRYPEGLQI